MRTAFLIVVTGCIGSSTSLEQDAPGSAEGTLTSPTVPTTPTAPTTPTPLGPWRRTIEVDGRLQDFSASEAFPHDLGVTYVTWDDTHLFVGVAHPDVAESPNHWFVVTVGRQDGLSQGVAHGQQEPRLAFQASHVVEWNSDGTQSHLWTAQGGSWVLTDSTWSQAKGSLALSPGRNEMEAAIRWDTLGGRGPLRVHTNWVYSGPSQPWSYSPIPTTSFLASYDPNYYAWYAFDPEASAAPASYEVQRGDIPGADTADTGLVDDPDTGDTADMPEDSGARPTAITGDTATPTSTADTGQGDRLPELDTAVISLP